ncbi:glycosyltransferase [Planctomycetota bacterium]
MSFCINSKYPPANRGTIIVWGLLSSMPIGGIFFQVLHHIVGFRRIGFDVWYVEDSDRTIPDEDTWMPTKDYSRYTDPISYAMELVGLQDRWIFRIPETADECLGATDFEGLMTLYKRADAVFNLCGSQETLPHHDVISCRAYLETDPVFPQISIASGKEEIIDAYEGYNYIFTYAENIGNIDCSLPTDRFTWHPTRPPVITDWWNFSHDQTKHNKLTTIANWSTKDKDAEWKDKAYYWKKDFTRFIDLPSQSKIPLELALKKIDETDRQKMQDHGWLITDADEIVTLEMYRNYISTSLGEFTITKDSYASARSGWFSDRSVCYLAAGCPVITEETGFSKFIPTGEGLFSFVREEEILKAIDAIYSDYQKQSERAKEIAEEYFKAETILGNIVDILKI